MSDPVRRGRGRPRISVDTGVKLAPTPASDDPILAPMPLAGQATFRLRRMIIEGDLEPGQPLSENALSEVLGISRTPLRQAFQQLSAEGLIVLRPNRGAIVVPMTVEETENLFEALACVESSAAELAAQRAAPEAHERLAALQRKLEDHHDQRNRLAYFQANQEIHVLIVAMSGNPVLNELHKSIFPRAERARLIALDQWSRWDESVGEHRAILSALARQDGPEARTLMARHVESTGDAVRKQLEAR